MSERLSIIKAIYLQRFTESIGEGIFDSMWEMFLLSLGTSLPVIGLIDSILSTTIASFSWLGGLVSDMMKKGRAFILGIAITAIAPLLYLLSHSWKLFAVGVIVEAVGSLIIEPLVVSAIVATSEQSERGSIFGKFHSILTFSLLVGMVIGGYVADSYNFRVMFLIIFVFWILRLIFILPKYYELNTLLLDKKEEEPLFSNISRRYSGIKDTPGTREYIVVSTVTTVSLWLSGTFFLVFARSQLGLSYSHIGLLAAINMVGMSISSLLLGNISDKVGRKPPVVFCLGLSVVSILIFAFSQQVWLTFVSFFLVGFSGYFQTGMVTIEGELVHESMVGTWKGLVQSVNTLVAIPFPVLGGIIWEQYSPQVLFGCTAVLLLVAVLLFIALVPETYTRGDLNE